MGLNLLVGFCLFVLGFAAHAQDQLQLVLPVSPGGLVHRIAEEYSPVIAKVTGIPVVEVFKPGVQGKVGAKYVSSQPGPDLVLMIGATQAWSDPQDADLAWSKDLEPIACLGVAAAAVVALPDAPFNTYKEFLEFSKTHPTAYGVPGASAHPPLFRQIHAKYGGQNITEVFYKTGNEVAVNVVGGHLPVGVVAVDGAIGLIREGKLKPLAVFGTGRSRLLPDVPTLEEQGLVVKHANRYYNNLFLWANKSADPRELSNFKVSFFKWMNSPEAKATEIKLDLLGATRNDVQTKKLMKSLTEN